VFHTETYDLSSLQALLSAPAENLSGTGLLSTKPVPLKKPGQFDSIPAGAPAAGHEVDDGMYSFNQDRCTANPCVADHLWYVNAFPADGVKYALANLTETYFGGSPALVVTGPNVGVNVGIATQISGTVGAAVAAVAAGVPAIAFSGDSGPLRGYKELQPGDNSFIYADASVRFTNAIVAAGAPYLPSGLALNVNFPAAGPGTQCTSGDSFKFVLSRVHWVFDLPIDVQTCGSQSLPSESSVIGTNSGCFASVSVFKASSKLDVGKEDQAAVLAKIGGILSCLP
jgi:5'-nucleotidase